MATKKDLTSLDLDLDVIGAALEMQEILHKIRAGELKSCEVKYVLNRTGVSGMHDTGFKDRERLIQKALQKASAA